MNKLFILLSGVIAALATVSADDTNTLNDAMIRAWLERRYAADMLTAAGRAAWHGELVREAIDTNAAAKVSTYADGYTHKEPMVVKDPLSAKAKAVDKGLPERLRAVREKRAAEKASVRTVTVETVGNPPKTDL